VRQQAWAILINSAGAVSPRALAGPIALLVPKAEHCHGRRSGNAGLDNDRLRAARSSRLMREFAWMLLACNLARQSAIAAVGSARPRRTYVARPVSAQRQNAADLTAVRREQGIE